jgi:hypothetical protein
MTFNTIANYINTKQINLDTKLMAGTCMSLENHILAKWNKDGPQTEGQYRKLADALVETGKTTVLYYKYNLLLYPYGQLYDLYKEISTFFKEVAGEDALRHGYYMQCWLNIYKKGQFIGWHSHSGNGNKDVPSYHGFYCVTGEGSKTTYKVVPNKDYIDVPTVPNQIVMSKCSNDMHRTWPWEGDEPRITIAFDITCRQQINFADSSNKIYHRDSEEYNIPSKANLGEYAVTYNNHWIPII